MSAVPPVAAPGADAGATPVCGFIGWGRESAALLAALRVRYPDVEAQAAVLAVPGVAPDPRLPPVPARTLPSLEALFQACQLLFIEGGAAALAPHLPVIRLAISDRHVLVLLGGGWTLNGLLEQLHERKLARCTLLPTSPGHHGGIAYHTSPWFTPAEREAFQALFAHLEPCVELGEEAHFDVLQGLADFAPAAFYTAMEAMADGVVMMGFSRGAAMQVLATLLHDASGRVLEGPLSAAQLREQALEVDVAAAGLIELESAGIRGALMRAIQRAVRRPRTATLPSPEESQ